jgi:hypothetical protein
MIEQCFAAHDVVHTCRCSHILNNIVEPESGVTILFNIVDNDNCEQCGQQNIVQSCFHQLLQQPDRFKPCNQMCLVCPIKINQSDTYYASEW